MLFKKIILLVTLWEALFEKSAATDFVDIGTDEFDHLTKYSDLSNPSTIIAKGFEISSVSDEHNPDHRHHHLRKLDDDACEIDPIVFQFEFVVIFRPWDGVFDASVASLIEHALTNAINSGACGACIKVEELSIRKQLVYLPDPNTHSGRFLQGGLKQGWAEGRVVGRFTCSSPDCASLDSLFGDRRRLRGTVDVVDRRLQATCAEAVRNELISKNPSLFGGLCEISISERSPACTWQDTGVEIFRR